MNLNMNMKKSVKCFTNIFRNFAQNIKTINIVVVTVLASTKTECVMEPDCPNGDGGINNECVLYLFKPLLFVLYSWSSDLIFVLSKDSLSCCLWICFW